MKKTLWQRLLRWLGFRRDPWIENRIGELQRLFEDLGCQDLGENENVYHYLNPRMKGAALIRIESNGEVVLEHIDVGDLRTLLDNRR